MAYPYDAADLAALSRLQVTYNGGIYDAGSNPGGFGQGGHVVNFLPALTDVAIVGEAVADAADAAQSSASAAATSETNAGLSAAKLQGTSTTSNTISVGSKSFTTQANKSFAAGTFVVIYSAANPSVNVMGGQVSSYSGTALVVNVTAIGSGSGNTATDWVIAVAGSPGAAGTIGTQGVQGSTPAVQMTFSTDTTTSDPGNGRVKFDNATLASVSAIYADNVDNALNSITAWLDAMDDSTNTALRGTLYIQQLSDSTKRVSINVSGTVTDSSGYRTIVVSGGTGLLPDNNAPIAILFARTGDKGADGAGAGDTISDIAVVVDGQLVKYNGTTGKHITDAGASIGTSGANLGKLNANVTYSGTRSFATLADFQQDVRLSGDISPTQIAANTDDYAPTGIATASVLRLTTDASRNLTGITTGADGRILLLINIGSNNLVLKDEVTSTAANRFSFGADVTLGAKQSAFIWYDSTSSRWRLCHPFIAGTSGHTVVYADGANTWLGVQTFVAKVDVQQDFYLSGDISPTILSADQNDYNPTGLSTSSVLRLSSDASRNITGLQGGADGRIVALINVGANDIVLVDASASSSAANRFAFGYDATLSAGQSKLLIYDATSSRWRPLQSAHTPLSGGDGTVSLPAFSFASDPDCGLYRIGANNLGIAVNGAKVLDVGTTGVGITGLGTITGDSVAGGTAIVSNGRVNSIFDANTRNGIVLKDTAALNGGGFCVLLSNVTQIGSVTNNNNTGVLYNTTSDGRLKTDKRPFEGAGKIIDKTVIWDFAWKATGKRDIGVIAQEAYKVFPNAITKPRKRRDPWQSSYSNYVPVLLAEAKESRKRIAALEAKVAQLIKQISK